MAGLEGEGGTQALRYVLAWFPMLVIAVANGALRQLTFAKVMSELRAHQISTLVGAPPVPGLERPAYNASGEPVPASLRRVLGLASPVCCLGTPDPAAFEPYWPHLPLDDEPSP